MNQINSLGLLRPDTLIKNLDNERVVSAVSIPSDARSVWEVVGNFAGFPAFIPALDSCEMNGTGVRSVRKKLFKDGNVVIEQLNSRDDVALFMTWSLIYTTLPVGNLWASMSVIPQGDEHCIATWSIVGEPSADWPDSPVAFQAFLQGFADDAMNNVLKLFS
ncbi:SRPBCC family protein [Pseudomonas sp. 10B1]|uniref:SRPBCC family protein n=1 Tax=unclassified Pseudomonas TaxID=196821 RepID=UPI002AB3C425|nr:MULTISPECIES: SRPBCC family protein [unclassified Pseudomonas]MDY7562444.1 SRPBCC family protein [Pseudomonas sp. AB6]MEA9979904.1 SRPBCC family protein [Pseudomonas sp. RTS4]MEA9996827.1 SRPBCC family protein [Pseudomonas sp. AA4]MEB0089515.1 SRPBCC family protein [Pseudomonas sp. RTI1]MEB0126498.1 SRPBCC family protein [Pseudomonas sp. CCC1.2]